MINTISRRASRIVFLLVVLMVAVSAAFAQVPPDNNVEQPAVQVISTVTASATAERVRFSSPNTVVQLRLEVYDEAGQRLLDTEQRGGNVIDWHLQVGSGERVADGAYLCVLTIKNLAGRISQKLGRVTVSGQSTVVRSAAVSELGLRQAESVGPVESGEAGLTVMGTEDTQPVTVLAHNGDEGQLARTRGALTFRVGDFFSGNDKEQMRLTEEGNLGIGTTKPKVKLDVAGVIRAREGFMFSDGSTLKLNEKGVLTRTNADGSGPSPATTTQNKIAKFTDNAGTVGDSVITESAGNIGINTATPTQALDVANGSIVTTGSQTLTSPLDSVIEVKTAVTNNADFVASFKARNFFNGSGNGPVGMDIAPTFAPTNSIGLARGFVSAAFFAPPPGVTISEAWGGNAVTIYNNTGGAVTNGNAFAINSPYAFGALKPTTQYGLHINNQGINGTNTSYGLFVDAQSGSLNNYSAIFAGGNVGIGTTSPTFKLHLVDPSNTGLRVQTNTAGGTVASFGGNGDFQIDAAGVVGGRLAVKESGNVGIGTFSPSAKLSVVAPGSTEIAGTAQSSTFRTTAGSLGNTAGDELSLASLGYLNGNNTSLGIRGRRITSGADWTTTAIGLGMDVDNTVRAGDATLWLHANGNVGIGQSNPTAKLTVQGTVQSNSGGFKFPDGTVQTTAANTTYTTVNDTEVALTTNFPDENVLLHLNLPAGTYLLTATIRFRNNANFFAQDNNRYVMCRFPGEPGSGDGAYRYQSSIAGPSEVEMTFHSVSVISSGGVDVFCRPFSWLANLFAESRRLTAVKIEGNVFVQ